MVRNRLIITVCLLSLLAYGCAGRKYEPTIEDEQPIPEAGSPGWNLGEFDLPIVLNDPVREQIDRFTGPERTSFALSLERFGSTGIRIRQILAERGLPQDLVFVAMIESCFNPQAVSRSRAVGVWQFMEATALEYGLKIDSHVDQRRDPIAASQAAATYLAGSYKIFTDWPLAIASYNAGVGGVQRAMQKAGARNFWHLAKTNHLKEETRPYVPRVYAAAIITHNPAAYGFSPPIIDTGKPDAVTISRPLTLAAASRLAGTTEAELVRLNPELIRKTTPPGEQSYRLQLPAGTAERFNLAHRATFTEQPDWLRVHVVIAGETLNSIAKDNDLTPESILAVNETLKETSLKEGDRIHLPLPPLTKAQQIGRERLQNDRTGHTAAESGSPRHPRRNAIVEGSVSHTVGIGDNLWKISRQYDTAPEDIRRRNDLADDRLRLGQKLIIPAPRAADPSQTLVFHTVAGGETLSSIARLYRVTVEQLRHWNEVDVSQALKVGLRLMIVTDR